MSMTPDEITYDWAGLARKTADIIVERGWTQNRLVAVDGCGVCVQGAIYLALGDEVVKHSAFLSPYTIDGRIADLQVFRSFCHLLERAFPGADFNVPQWNDQPGQTQEAVVQFLYALADEIEPHQNLVPEPALV